MLDPVVYPDPSQKVIPAAPFKQEKLSIGPTAWGRKPTTVLLRGDLKVAQNYVGLARSRAVLGHIINGNDENSMQVFDLPFGAPGGVTVDFFRRFDEDKVVVTAPPRERIEKRPFIINFNGETIDKNSSSIERITDSNFGLPLYFSEESPSESLPSVEDFGNGKKALCISNDIEKVTTFYSRIAYVNRNSDINDYTLFMVAKNSVMSDPGKAWTSLVYGNQEIMESLSFNTFYKNRSNYIGFSAGTTCDPMLIENGKPYVISLVSRAVEDMEPYDDSYNPWGYDGSILKEQHLYVNGELVVSANVTQGYYLSNDPSPTYFNFQSAAMSGSALLAQAAFNGQEAMSAENVKRVSDKLASRWGI